MKKANRLRALMKTLVDGIEAEGKVSDRNAKAMMATAIKRGREIIKLVEKGKSNG